LDSPPKTGGGVFKLPRIPQPEITLVTKSDNIVIFKPGVILLSPDCVMLILILM